MGQVGPRPLYRQGASPPARDCHGYHDQYLRYRSAWGGARRGLARLASPPSLPWPATRSARASQGRRRGQRPHTGGWGLDGRPADPRCAAQPPG
jgi:hypothetical protein